MTDGPGTGAPPAASPRRRAGQDVVVRAVWPLGNGAAAEAEIVVPGIAARPAAGPRSERDDLLGGGQAWAGEGGYRGRDGGGGSRSGSSYSRNGGKGGYIARG